MLVSTSCENDLHMKFSILFAPNSGELSGLELGLAEAGLKTGQSNECLMLSYNVFDVGI